MSPVNEFLNAVTVCVEYDDILSITAPRNRPYFNRHLIVTDQATAPRLTKLAEEQRLDVLVTTAFYEGGADFNKWLALEQGIDAVGRAGWLCILDADILLPNDMFFLPRIMRPGFIYTPRRRMMPEIPASEHEVPHEADWGAFPVHPNSVEWAGYCQIFHADDPALGPAPWHQVDWRHAGGADSFFQAKWRHELKVRPPFYCLHLGPSGENWCGRVTPRTDGTTPPQAADRLGRLQGYLRGRRQCGRNQQYANERLPPPQA